MTETTFTPSADTARQFREALGCFATGVTVVTARHGTPVGMTANSFASVSLEPPLILWSPAKQSARHAVLTECAHFSVHVLGEDQIEIARAFAGAPDPFDTISHHDTPEGTPVFEALARFDCATHAVHDGGDHSIVIGRVLRATHDEGAGLVFKRGEFGRFFPQL